ncbi:hypothetical protein OO012_10355 [Rhodobacteraceae bacterium KMM 6894]|nr:hypothetical protein [Rhodobacteraceae bacterium KMM 6894]
MSETTKTLLELVARERRMAVSEREWQHRLRGYGYGIRDTDDGRMITSLVYGSAICTLPVTLSA